MTTRPAALSSGDALFDRSRSESSRRVPIVRLVKRLLLAIVVAPALVTLLLLGAEAVARLALAADSAAAPARYFVASADGRALVPGPRPPHGGAHFRVERLEREKAPGVVRVVCLGDSTVHGHPFDPPAPFADWLAARLPELLPGHRFEVWNLGVNGMNAEAVADVAAELAPLSPDLAIVYVGHNEFLDQHLPAAMRPWSHALHRALGGSWFFGWLAQRLGSVANRDDTAMGGDRLLLERLRDRGALDDEPLLEPALIDRALDRYEASLQRLVTTLAAAGTTSLLCVPICDLPDTPPQRSTLPVEATAAERTQLRAELRDPGFDRAAHAAAWQSRWPQVAAVRYALGQLAQRNGDFAMAHREFIAARDLDGHPVRATTELQERMRRVATRERALLIDPWPALTNASGATGLAGQNGWFVDYVHPDLRGHELLADALLHGLADANWLAPRDEWRFADEPDRAAYALRMGLSPAAQATSLARRGLFALGQAYLDPDSELAKGAADSFERALRLDPECALGFAGRGALALLRADGKAALAAFDEAARRDPAALDFFVQGDATNATVHQLFEKAGLMIRSGQIVAREPR